MIAKFLFCFFIQFVALWLDLFFSSNGYQSAFCALVFIYTIITYSWFWALPFALVSFTIYDNLTNLIITNCFFIFILIGIWWKNNGDCSRLNLMIIPYSLALICQYVFLYLLLDIKVFLFIKFLFISFLITLPLGMILSSLFNKLARYFSLPQSTLNEEK